MIACRRRMIFLLNIVSLQFAIPVVLVSKSMKPTRIVAAVVALTTLHRVDAASKDSCAPIDFTTKEAEFADLDDAIKTTAVGKLLGSVVGEIDPLTRENIELRNFSYSAMGKDMIISTSVQSITIEGLSAFEPVHINVTSANSISIRTSSQDQVTIDAVLDVYIDTMDVTINTKVNCVLEKPVLSVDVEANLLECAKGIPASQCSDLTVQGLQSELKKAVTRSNYVSIMKEVLMKVENASVSDFSLDFESISDVSVDYDSPGFWTRQFLKVVPEYSADDINSNDESYTRVVSIVNKHAPSILNSLIDSFLQPLFGATCISEN
ncbi:uncharacterized protein PHALS_09287 [Plasmopara halstedii]|uniref:RxLR-like protein n=1 Tax=Plasmopara halstedii TaxID=4781 RepID=A0A0P1AE57_PLAHL|nr:uncharacterized protein PHALS_09287 [Plasmopara halstedii]CEG39234.1 hypothetical protein PHALS_09287 [Plasmopara halstedii]|eukprot:XP_024575603.1 hypothetical protein PHALS_09287 [Plasmopara halstedii]